MTSVTPTPTPTPLPKSRESVSSRTPPPDPSPDRKSTRLGRSALTSPRAWVVLLVTVMSGASLDLYTKHIAFDRLAAAVITADGSVEYVPERVYRFIPDLLHFQTTKNHGAVFGIGQGQRTFFVTMSVLAGGFLVYLFAVSGRRPGYHLLLGMLLAGVIGNLYDRVRFGFVRDMIHIFPAWDIFPWIFNVADSLLCVGVTLMLVYTFVYGDGRTMPDDGPTPADDVR